MADHSHFARELREPNVHAREYKAVPTEVKASREPRPVPLLGGRPADIQRSTQPAERTRRETQGSCRCRRCYTLQGSRPPFYAINATNRTVHYYRSAGCAGEVGGLTPNMSGNVTRYVKFD